VYGYQAGSGFIGRNVAGWQASVAHL